MAALERLRKKLLPLTDLDDCEPHSPDGTAPKVSADGRSCVQFKISRLCIQKRRPRTIDDKDDGSEQSYHCASDEMCVFEAIGWGASSVVRKAIHIPAHRIIALKKINIFEKEKRQQLLNKIRTLCEAPRAQGLVEFIGAFYNPDSGYINIALEYMDGGSLADIVRIKKCIPEPILSVITHKILQGLQHLHGVRHLVHRDIKPANLLMNLVGEPKITDFGLSAGLDNSISMCATFVGSVTYMSPERIKNERYSYPADIWSLGLSLLECATGEFPYDPTKGNVDVMLQILDDPSPSLPADTFSSEFCSFIDTCLWREAGERASAKELLLHPFIKKYENAEVDLGAFVQNVFDPNERLKDLTNMLIIHYYMLFDGPDSLWPHMKTMYKDNSILRCTEKEVVGAEEIFDTLSNMRSKLIGELIDEKLVHVVKNVDCFEIERHRLKICVNGSFVVGTHFIPTGNGVQVEGLPYTSSLDLKGKEKGAFNDCFIVEPGEHVGSFYILKQKMYYYDVALSQFGIGALQPFI